MGSGVQNGLTKYDCFWLKEIGGCEFRNSRMKSITRVLKTKSVLGVD